MPRQIKTVEDFFMEHGGIAEIGKKLDINPWNIIKWKHRGIPQKFWDVIMKHYGMSPAELFTLTKIAKLSNGNGKNER